MKNIKVIFIAHNFFCRKSQHFVLGGWSEHKKMGKDKLYYYINFIPAYIRFMKYTIKDLIKNKQNNG